MSKKSRDKRQPSAAAILSESNVDKDPNDDLADKIDCQIRETGAVTKELYRAVLNQICDLQEKAKKEKEEWQEKSLRTLERQQETLNLINEKYKDVIDENKKMQKTIEFLKEKFVSLAGQNKTVTAKGNPSANSDVQKLKEENLALKREMEATKSELRALKDEYLLNLERQNESTLVVHGLPEHEDESEKDLQMEVDRIITSTLDVPVACVEAHRVGKKGENPRVVKVRWENYKHCRDILDRHKNLPKGIYFNKDRPFILREIRRKIREKAKELWQNKIEYEYKDLGLNYNGKFHHYSEFEGPTS